MQSKTVETYTYIYQQFAANTNEVADAVFEGDRAAALSTLSKIFGSPLLYDNGEGVVDAPSDGSHPKFRNGQYMPAMWQCNLSMDYGTLEESMADAGVMADGTVA